jgi:flagellar biosynthesis/type III secretory pathway protein FliH
MSKIEIKPFEEQIRIAGIAGELERAEEAAYEEGFEKGYEEGFEKGYAKGCAETEEKFILKFLETQSPEEISTNFEVPLERVLEIENGNG